MRFRPSSENTFNSVNLKLRKKHHLVIVHLYVIILKLHFTLNLPSDAYVTQTKIPYAKYSSCVLFQYGVRQSSYKTTLEWF